MTGNGRPYRGELISVRIPPEAIAAIDTYADTHGISRAEAIRHIINEWQSNEEPTSDS